MHKEPERPNNDRINILEERMKCVQYLWPNKKNNTNPATYSKAVTADKAASIPAKRAPKASFTNSKNSKHRKEEEEE